MAKCSTAYSQQGSLFYCAARQSPWPSFIAFEWQRFHSVWMKEAADAQADLMEHSRGGVHECLCQTRETEPDVLTTRFLRSPRTFWEMHRIISHRCDCPLPTHPLHGGVKATFLVHFTNLVCYSAASRTDRLWTILLLSVENEITFYPLTSVMEMRLCCGAPPGTYQNMSLGLNNPTEVSN